MTKTFRQRSRSRPSLRVVSPEAAAPAIERTDPLRSLRWLIWTYFWLLLFEGALRKWALPSLANPLLIIRDPVLIAIYALAFTRGVFPMNKFVIALAVVGIFCLVTTMFAPYFSLGVHIFGFRCDFLHLPLIYVMGRVFDLDTVRRVGLCVLLVALPMTALVVMQFRSAPDAFLNAGAGVDAADPSARNVAAGASTYSGLPAGVRSILARSEGSPQSSPRSCRSRMRRDR